MNKVTPTDWIFGLIIAKATIGLLTVWDCIGAITLLGFIQSEKVINYFFPKKPDLYREFALLQEQFDAIQKQNDDLESDVTALKMARGSK